MFSFAFFHCWTRLKLPGFRFLKRRRRKRLRCISFSFFFLLFLSFSLNWIECVGAPLKSTRMNSGVVTPLYLYIQEHQALGIPRSSSDPGPVLSSKLYSNHARLGAFESYFSFWRDRTIFASHLHCLYLLSNIWAWVVILICYFLGNPSIFLSLSLFTLIFNILHSTPSLADRERKLEISLTFHLACRGVSRKQVP